MTGAEEPALALANHILGDLSLSYPETFVSFVAVSFGKSVSIRGPILTRASLVLDPQRITRNCIAWDDASLVVDAIDSDTAIKITLPVSKNTILHSYHNYQDSEEFKNINRMNQRILRTKWSKIA